MFLKSKVIYTHTEKNYTLLMFITKNYTAFIVIN